MRAYCGICVETVLIACSGAPETGVGDSSEWLILWVAGYRNEGTSDRCRRPTGAGAV